MIREVYFLDYFDGLLEGDKNRCRKIVDALLDEGTGIIEIYTDLFQKALYQVGKLWDQNKLSIGDEHLGSQITEDLLYYCSSRIIPLRQTGKKALVSCVNKEFHKMGARMAADVFVLNGWETYFLGASIPTKEIIKYVDSKKPDIVGLSFSFYINVMKLFDVVKEIKNKFPSQRIVIGGRADLISQTESIKKYDDVHYFSSIADLDKFLKDGSF